MRACLKIFFSLLPLVMWGCISYEVGSCQTGISARFYSKTPCAGSLSYPSVDEIDLFVFDAAGTLVNWQATRGVTLSRDYSEDFNLPKGDYSVVAWAGLDSGFYDVASPVDGATTKTDLLFNLRRVAGQAGATEGSRVWFGQSGTVKVRDGTLFYKDVGINLSEVTNRFVVTVKGLTTPADYEIVIESDTGSMNLDGTIASDTDIFYAGAGEVKGTDLENRFTMIGLKEGYVNTLEVRSATDGTVVWSDDLLTELILKNPTLNLACNHDFDIEFTVDEQDDGTYIVLSIYVNRWLVHSYSTGLSVYL